jgi:hypothetical protein
MITPVSTHSVASRSKFKSAIQFGCSGLLVVAGPALRGITDSFLALFNFELSASSKRPSVDTLLPQNGPILSDKVLGPWRWRHGIVALG